MQVSQKETEFDFVSEMGYSFICVDEHICICASILCLASTSRFAFNKMESVVPIYFALSREKRIIA